MARIVFISPYLKGGKNSARLRNSVHYFATRPGVELLPTEGGHLPPSKKQRSYVARLVRSFPESTGLLEYEDYLAVPTCDSASAFIEQATEQFVAPMDARENHIDYIAHRPGVQSYGEHGLWDAHGKVQNLSAAMEEVSRHSGNVWTPVVALRREDAERLNYASAENWRALVNAVICDIAKGYKIHPDHLRWYATFHEKETQVHIHMVIFSADPKEGYLTKQGIRDIKSAFARQIYRQELICVYERQTEYRDTLQRDAASLMAEYITQMERGSIHNETLEQLTIELSRRLQTTTGKKVYGYLPPATKRIVDAIVDELAKDTRVAKAYILWQQMRDEVCRTYDERPPQRLPLSQQKEFKPVRNMVIREAMKLTEVGMMLEQNVVGPIPKEPSVTAYIDPIPTASQQPIPSSAPTYSAYSSAAGHTVLRMLHHMGNIFREKSTADNIHAGMQIDKKRRRQLRQKRMAMGHNPKDREQEQKYIEKLE